ncbi:MAG TPA: carbon-nitrogen hydrolase family protein [Gemmatimonadales bacterium]|nr:carbon-nitrogen hydrolase family protein [Gemmatimonadales bacterium]
MAAGEVLASVRVAVCESAPEMAAGDASWRALVAAVRRQRPDIVLLNEMPFGAWIAAGERAEAAAFAQCRRMHDEGVEHLAELGAPIVLGTRATIERDRRVNQGFVWDADRGLLPVHTKQFFPDEPGYFEARWFDRGETHFRVAHAHGIGFGFLICTEVWFVEWARRYGRAGAHLIVVPRATPHPSLDRWLTAIRMAALVSGCYVASSNRAGTDSRGQEFGGRGWIVDPDGQVLAETSALEPVAAAEVELERVARAKREYPRYVRDL